MRRLSFFAVVILTVAMFSAPLAKAQATYFYVVTAVNADGLESVLSNEVSATITTAKHSVTANWVASTSLVAGYNLYRGKVTGGPYVKVNTALISGTTFTDTFPLPSPPTGLTAITN